MNYILSNLVLSMYAAFCIETASYFVCPRSGSFLRTRKRPDSHKSVADAVGVLDFPRKSFVQITGRAPPSFSLSPSVVRNFTKKWKNYKTCRICVPHYTISQIPENILFVVKSRGLRAGQWLLPETNFQIPRGSTFDTHGELATERIISVLICEKSNVL